ncbi:zinc-dependent metalloprotease family protein [Flavobacterium sp. SUN052]|uniref:zinc-dependent metalloprotease n=1 Tax=Flavobacterium sp. SUN052 TaxID=3002441 RepID=UPI00237EA525|nr:zinc-dependent metalloprotease family protein [Flavobacterium sp. SUN052]MEC4003304.1 zinc-dependent metalloprotease family protein [Flavobacterium sp. SUN052]
MKRKLLFTISAILIFTISFGQKSLWNKTTADRVSLLNKMDRAAMPRDYKLYNLDFNGLKAQLAQAPSENTTYSNVIVEFPNQNGELTSYRIFYAPVMEEALANKYPDIKSYVGKGVEDPTASIRFSTTIFGLHVMSISGKTETFYIDTYTKDLNNYIVYGRSTLSSTRSFECGFIDDQSTSRVIEQDAFLASDGKFRQYRLAMACTIEYAAYHVNAAGVSGGTLAQKKAAVLAAMVVTMTRVNGVYERDMSLRMNLIANNDLIIFIDSDNFSNDTASSLINESQTEIDAAIGLANYDIGHTVSTGGGGLAQLNSPCTSSKARGITGSPAPVGDAFDIDYVAHEMGHQFGGTHTFNGIGGNCTTGTRAPTTAVEPGSGTTIMAYAGICSPVDVQLHSDDYFHAVSIAQMSSFVAGTGNCAAFASNGNTPPVVNAGTDYTIPKGTAFILTPTSATDVNGDSLTYCWEETDNSTSFAQPPVATATGGPNFRSFSPSTSQERYIPVLSSVVAGNLAPTWEVVSTVGRTYNFALTVRDNRTPNGGQTSRDNVVITASSTVGPFSVSSQSNTEAWVQGNSYTVTWVRNGSETLSTNVNIYLSTDGGLTFPTLLTPSGVPNSGTATVTAPNVTSQTCRLMVRAKENIYYAVNSTNFYIGYTITNTCNTYNYTVPFSVPDGSSTYTIKTIAVPSTSGTISDVNITVNATHPNIQNLNIAAVRPGGSLATLYNQGCASGANMNVTFDTQGTAMVCASPTIGSYQPSTATALSAMNGATATGTWQFGFRDLVAGNAGTIDSFSIQICTQVVALANDNFNFENFALYPNPNDGSFNIKFNSSTDKNIEIAIYDMRGREIFNKTYQNSGLFEQNLQLNNVQAGIYLVNIQDGDKKVVKKIIVE